VSERRPAAANRLPAAMVVASIVSVQCGAALATTLFDSAGTGGAVFLRALFAALALALLARGALRAVRGRPIGDAVLFGLVVAALTFSFYQAIDRLPLGIVVTIQFTGPLGVALLSSRRRRDLVWVAMAAAGILLLSGGLEGGDLDPVGVAFAFLAGALWAAYILLSERVGANHPGLSGAVVAAMATTLVLAPIGIADAGAELLQPEVLAVGLLVGVLSSAVPFAFELEALRHLPRGTFGVLMSLEPAAAAAIGFLALGQDLGPTEIVAIALVVAASAGALHSAARHPPRD
jgi:inner membrane transporter RhtA